MVMQTKRLILRHWQESDAEDLYTYAQDPDVGPIAGWPAHTSIEDSRRTIKEIFCAPEAYAICLKEDRRAIGAIELKLFGHADLAEHDNECELGFWLGKPFWGRGIVPEAAQEMLRHAFEDLHMSKVWCGYYEGNLKSLRAQEKIGFIPQRTIEHVYVKPMKDVRTCHANVMTKEVWEKLHSLHAW